MSSTTPVITAGLITSADQRRLLDGPLGALLALPAEATDGRLSVVIHDIAPRTLGAPIHTHRNEDEYSYVLDGLIGVQVGDRDYEARAGDTVAKPRGIAHAFWNPTDHPARFVEIITRAASRSTSRASARRSGRTGRTSPRSLRWPPASNSRWTSLRSRFWSSGTDCGSADGDASGGERGRQVGRVDHHQRGDRPGQADVEPPQPGHLVGFARDDVGGLQQHHVVELQPLGQRRRDQIEPGVEDLLILAQQVVAEPRLSIIRRTGSPPRRPR